MSDISSDPDPYAAKVRGYDLGPGAERDISSVTGSDEMAEYVRDHRCWRADPDVSLADWDRGIAAIQREAVEPWRKAVERLLESGGADTFTPEADTAWRGLRVLLEGQDR